MGALLAQRRDGSISMYSTVFAWTKSKVGLVAAFVAASMGASAMGGHDARIQDRLYDHLDHAQQALLYGHANEATAYAEMILLKRDITVYVDATNVPWQIKEDAATALRDAAVNWEDSLGREIKFRFVQNPDADLVVYYTEGLKFDGKESAGTTRWSRNVMDLGSDQYQYKVNASILLRTYTPYGQMMNYKQMVNTAGHELGHDLGLEDSPRQGDIMGPLRLDRPVERPAPAETQSLLAVRQQADLILQKINGNGGLQGPMVFAPTDFQVVSSAAEHIELQEDCSSVSGDRRRAPVVRRHRRDRKAAPRAARFAIGGMAD